jgi:DNA polymerase I
MLKLIDLKNYEYITHQSDVDLIIADAKKNINIAVDTENSGGLDPFSKDFTILLMQIAFDNKAYVIDARRVNLNPFKEILEDPRYVKVLQNAIYDFKSLYLKKGITIHRMYDTMISEGIIWAGLEREQSNSLEALTQRYLNKNRDKTIRSEFIDFPIDYEFTDAQIKYAAEDTLDLIEIKRLQQMYLNQYSLNSVVEIELSLIEPVAMMEIKGFKLDAVKWAKTLKLVKEKLFKLSTELRSELPAPDYVPVPVKLKKDGTPYKGAVVKPPPVLNIDSWQQIEVAFKKVGINLEEADKATHKGITNVNTLKYAKIVLYTDDKKKQALIDKFMAYRSLNQVQKTFGDNLIDCIKNDGRIHASFHQVGTDSGRFSSSDPNLQNIQKKGDEGKILRTCFVPESGFKFVIADYSQIELRIAAYMSQDPKMLSILSDPKGDIHRGTASEMFGIPYKSVTSKMRTAAKTLNFGIIYGMSTKTLAERLGIDNEEAAEHLQRYKDNFKGLMAWMSDEETKSSKRGYTLTQAGRIRWYKSTNDIKDPDEKRKMDSFYNRVSRNHPVQGCLPPDTRVLTPDGWVKIRDFNDGMVWTGEKWAYAVKVNRGVANRLRLHLSDGRTFDCDNRHYLLVNDGVYPHWEDVNTIVGKSLVRDAGYDWGQSINTVEDWYWVGRMIGDGYLSNFGWGCAFASKESKDVDNFITWLDTKDIKGLTNSQKGYGIEQDKNNNFKVYGYTKKGKALWESFGMIVGHGAKDKRIPSILFNTNRERRQSFFDGYMDSDGYKRRRSSKITSVNRLLLEDTLRLMQTIGMTGHITNPMKNGIGCVWYDLDIHKTIHNLTVTKIESLIDEEMFTLSVDDDRHSFSTEGLISKNTSADMTKTAMALMYNPLKDMNAYVVNTIHDEVCVEVPIDYAIEAAHLVKRKMMFAGSKFLSPNKPNSTLKPVPVLVDIKIRDAWYKDDGVDDSELGQQLWLPLGWDDDVDVKEEDE